MSVDRDPTSNFPKPVDKFFLDDEKLAILEEERRRKNKEYRLRKEERRNRRKTDYTKASVHESVPRAEPSVTRVLHYSENDFPQLGCKKANKAAKETVVSDTETPQEERIHETETKMLPTKVLGSNKHKEAFSVNIEDVFLKTNDKLQQHKHRTRPVKRINYNVPLCGNPLDSDNPARRKGIVSLKPKPKRVSKTKTIVYEAREEVKRLKELAQGVSIENAKVYRGNVEMADLEKTLCVGKVGEIRKYLRDEDRVEVKSELADIGMPLRVVLNEFTNPPYKLLLHNSSFKRYCDNCILTELNSSAEKLVQQIVRYQYNKYQTDPIKATAKKRYVLGLRQAKKYTKMNKIKLIVLVPNMEESLTDTVEELKSLAVAYCIPYLFAFSRKKLGYLAYKKVGVCCFGILDYSGAEEHFKQCLESMSHAKKMYNEKSALAENYYEGHFPNQNKLNEPATPVDINEEIIKDFISKVSLYHEDNISESDEDELTIEPPETEVD